MIWRSEYFESAYKCETLAILSGIDVGSFRKYLNGSRKPRKKNLEKMEEAMKIAGIKKRLEFHPSYGFATQEQIDQLKKIGVGIDRDLLLRQIDEQTRNKGKYL